MKNFMAFFIFFRRVSLCFTLWCYKSVFQTFNQMMQGQSPGIVCA